MIYPVRAAQYAASMLFTLLIAQAAHAVEIVVGGLTYEIGFYDNTRADTIVADLTSTPWYGNSSTAGTAATDFYTANGNSNDIGIGAILAISFVYDYTDTAGQDSVSGRFLDAAGSVGFGGTFDDSAYSNIPYAYVITPVPEIDGNALAKALFVLFAFGVWLRTRGRRQGRSSNALTLQGTAECLVAHVGQYGKVSGIPKAEGRAVSTMFNGLDRVVSWPPTAVYGVASGPVTCQPRPMIGGAT